MADLIVLGGAAAIEKAAKEAGHKVKVPFTPGRTDASQEMTDVQSFAVLEPTADAFRNYYSDRSYASPTKMLVEKADLLTLTVPRNDGAGRWHARPERQYRSIGTRCIHRPARHVEQRLLREPARHVHKMVEVRKPKAFTRVVTARQVS